MDYSLNRHILTVFIQCYVPTVVSPVLYFTANANADPSMFLYNITLIHCMYCMLTQENTRTAGVLSFQTEVKATLNNSTCSGSSKKRLSLAKRKQTAKNLNVCM